MSEIEKKHKHLDYIQAVINRIANNSFLIKGWTITLVVGVLAFSTSNNFSCSYFIITFIPVFAFWTLDGYYLFQERLYRAKYKKVIKIEEDKIDYDMVTDSLKGNGNTWIASIFSSTLVIFYSTLIFSIIIIIIFYKPK
jgi:hypothetical protein